MLSIISYDAIYSVCVYLFISLIDFRRNVLRNKMENITKEFLHSVIIDKNYEILDECISSSFVVSNSHGVALGPEDYISLSTRWHTPFRISSLLLTKNDVGTRKITYAYCCKAKHVGKYMGIEESGLSLDIRGVLGFTFDNEKISSAASVANVKEIITQLSPTYTKEYFDSAIKESSIDYSSSFFKMALQRLSMSDVNISCRELHVLTLWDAGFPGAEIARHLSLCLNTVRSYQDKLHNAFRSHKKHHIFCKLKEFEMEFIMNRCLLFILEKSPDNIRVQCDE